MIIHKDEVYEPIEHELYSGYRKAGAYRKATPTFTWKGPKLTLDEWRRGLAFLMWVYKTSSPKSEGQLRGFLVGNEIKLWAFPQEKNSGMTTKEIPGELMDEQMKQFSGCPEILTIHSHCDSSAFQSGTDKHDEVNKSSDGLHITVGHLGKDYLDLHARAYFDGLEYDPALDQWVDPMLQPQTVDDLSRCGVCAKSITKIALTRNLAEPEFMDPSAFPEVWRTNLIARTYQYGGQNGSMWVSRTGINMNHVATQACDFKGCRYLKRTKRTQGKMSLAEKQTVWAEFDDAMGDYSNISSARALHIMTSSDGDVFREDVERALVKLRDLGYSKADAIQAMGEWARGLNGGKGYNAVSSTLKAIDEKQEDQRMVGQAQTEWPGWSAYD